MSYRDSPKVVELASLTGSLVGLGVRALDRRAL